MTCRTFLRTLPIAPAAVVVCCLLLAVVSPTSRAAVIEYSWEGTIEPLDPNEDPWNIGAEGKPFTISAIVDESAIDVQPEINIAVFSISSDVVLSIEGMRPTFLGDGHIVFDDHASGDSVSVVLNDVEFNGIRQPWSTGARVAASTFTFTSSSERPPLFLPVVMLFRGGSISEGSSYINVLDAGATVTATLIPEPSTFVLALFALLSLARTRWRSRKS